MHAEKRRDRQTLLARLSDPAFLTQCWRTVLDHYKKSEIPEALREFDRRRAARIDSLSARLREQTYIPQPASLIYIPKPNHPGEKRPIGLIEPEDRIVLTGLNTILVPILDRALLFGCCAYRRNRGASGAIESVHKAIQRGAVHVASGDIDDFFSNLDRDRLFRLLKGRVWETAILNLLETYLHIGTSRQLQWADTGRGVAQGSPLSPVLSNYYLVEFDRILESSGLTWFRYADNILLLGAEAEPVRETWAKAEAYLTGRCGLRYNPESVALTTVADGFEFLGFWFQGLKRTMSAAKMDQKRSALTGLLRGEASNLDRVVAEASETMKGWRVYYGAVEGTGPQLETLWKHFEDLFIPWMERYRSGPGKGRASAELKAALLPIEPPVQLDARRKLKWVELVLSRSRPAKKEESEARISPTARRAVHQRKEELAEKKREMEDLTITKPGTYLGRTGERILVRHDGKRQTEIPMGLVRNITFLTTAFSLSGEFLVETAARGISIVVAGQDGRLSVRIGPPELPGHELSLAQSTLASGVGGLKLARVIVAGKIRNQTNLLKYFLKYPERHAEKDYLEVTTKAVVGMEAIAAEVAGREFGADLELERNRLFAAEGNAAGLYWGAVRSMLHWKPGFQGRVRRGAGDLVNSLLNYGYGILYSRLFTVLARTGLNLNVGFLHKPQPGKAGLLYDFIEEFRAVAVDRTVLALLNLAAELKVTERGLDAETRHVLARRVIERLQTPVRYHGEGVALQRVMELQAQLLVRHVEGKETYKTFVMPW